MVLTWKNGWSYRGIGTAFCSIMLGFGCKVIAMTV
jgi:hypothetical protein